MLSHVWVVGAKLGMTLTLGALLGSPDGIDDSDGVSLGVDEGASLGPSDGDAVGVTGGVDEGVSLGLSDGDNEGVSLGSNDGVGVAAA